MWRLGQFGYLALFCPVCEFPKHLQPVCPCFLAQCTATRRPRNTLNWTRTVAGWATADPLAPLLALANNMVEIRVDGTNLCRTFQRPKWEQVLRMWLSFPLLSIEA